MFGVADLLAGPRGRRLCHELNCGSPDLASAFADSVASAKYWQQPDETDLQLAHPRATDQLRDVAAGLLDDPAAAWWTEPIDLDDQHFVQFEGVPGFETASAERWDRWHEEALAREGDAPDFEFSGNWWSTPTFAAPSTARSVDGIPVRLNLVEDAMSWRRATTVHCAVEPAARVYEIGDVGAWTEFVARYPLTVTRSRRWDWLRATGRDGAWLMPDYRAVAADFDAVHLSAATYLQGAGRALAVGDAATLIAGWDPDQTWWLTEVIAPSGTPQSWRDDDGWALG